MFYARDGMSMMGNQSRDDNQNTKMIDINIFIPCLLLFIVFVAWAIITFFLWFAKILKERERMQRRSLNRNQDNLNVDTNTGSF